MLRRVDIAAHDSRWRAKPGPVALFCAGLMALVLLLPPWPAAPLVLGVAIAAAGRGRVPIGLFLRLLGTPLGFAAVGGFALAVSVHWHEGLHWTLSSEGLHTGLCVAARAVAAAGVTLLFALTVPLARQVALGRRLGLSEALINLVLVTYRMLFLLEESRETILRTQTNRLGYRTARLALRSTALAGGGLFRRALARSQAMERGLAARGYDGRLRVLLSPDRSRPRDYLSALLVPGALAGAILLFP